MLALRAEEEAVTTRCVRLLARDARAVSDACEVIVRPRLSVPEYPPRENFQPDRVRHVCAPERGQHPGLRHLAGLAAEGEPADNPSLERGRRADDVA